LSTSAAWNLGDFDYICSLLFVGGWIEIEPGSFVAHEAGPFSNQENIPWFEAKEKRKVNGVVSGPLDSIVAIREDMAFLKAEHR